MESRRGDRASIEAAIDHELADGVIELDALVDRVSRRLQVPPDLVRTVAAERRDFDRDKEEREGLTPGKVRRSLLEAANPAKRLRARVRSAGHRENRPSPSLSRSDPVRHRTGSTRPKIYDSCSGLASRSVPSPLNRYRSGRTWKVRLMTT